MKLAIHPEVLQSKVVCASCGKTFVTRSVGGDLVVEVCSNCHPAYTGQMRTVPSGSRVARFERRLALAAK